MACLTKSDKFAVINRLTSGLSTLEVASNVVVSHTRVNKVAKRLLGAHVVKKGGHPAKLSPRTISFCARSTTSGAHDTAAEVCKTLDDAMGIRICTTTVHNT
ncbi:hypothetical protein GQ54DRAFT_261834 [Martensiomyces pterosporus]|nr:hypothetical protein GQ54DRAFT_261834 [Martensiomyces pterosporus]